MASPGTASTSSRPDQQETRETANPTTTPPVKKRRIQTDKTASPGSMSSTSSSRLETSPRYARTKIPRTRERSGGASELEHQKFGWVESYQERALLTRIRFLKSQSRKGKFCIHESIDKVKFFVKDEKTETFIGVPSLHQYSIPQFVELVKAKIVDGFEFNFGNEEPWERRRRGLKALNLVHDGAVWSVYPDLEKLAEESQDDQVFLTWFRTALLHNMMNGAAKNWLKHTFKQFIKDHPEWEHIMDFDDPTHSSPCITPVEQLAGESKYVDPYWNKPVDNEPLPWSSHKSTSESESKTEELSLDDVEEHSSKLSWSKPSRVVPDFLIFMDSYPGVFPLVVEIKSRDSGTNQNLKQMLSKMHFQDVVFGLMITPLKYALTAVIKTKGEIHVVRSDLVHLTERENLKNPAPDKTKGPLPLDVDSVHTIYKYISSVLQWAYITRCKIGKYDSAK